MKVMRLTTLLLASGLALTACKKEGEDGADGSKSTAAKTNIFDYVPADTPYLVGSLNSVPDDVIDHFIAAAEPMLGQMQALMGKAMEQLKADLEAEADAASEMDQKGPKLVSALLQELDGKLSRSGLESLGFEINGRQVIYGIGPFPVARVEIRDADALNTAVQRILQNAEISAEPKQLNGQSYWHISMARDKASLLVSIQPGQLAAAVVPSNLNDQVLPNLLSQEKPADALDAKKALRELNKEYSYKGYGSGYVDFQQLFSLFTDNNSPAATSFRSFMKEGPGSLSDVCKSEMRAMIAAMPRAVMGYNALNKSAMDFHMGLDLEDGLAAQLNGLTQPNTVFSGDPGGAMSFAMGVNITKTREWLLAKAEERVNAPYQCEKLAALNRGWGQAFAQLGQPLPPFIGNFSGFRLRLDDLQLAGTTPVSGKGVFAIYTPEPQMLMGMAQMFMPPLASANIEPGGEPHPLDVQGMGLPVPVDQAFIAMGADSIGIAMGEGTQALLKPFLENTMEGEGEVIGFGYDFSFYFDKLNDIIEGMPYDNSDENAEVMELQKAIMDTYANLLDRQYTVVRFSPRGIDFNQTVTLN